MKKNILLNYFPKSISKKQASDTGMAIVLILLLIGYFTQNSLYYKVSIPVLIINMAFPKFYYLFAIIWLGFSQLIGTITSNIVLTIVFVILVIPVGVVRKLLGRDPLRLSEFKKGTQSVMKLRNHKYSPKDIEYPY